MARSQTSACPLLALATGWLFMVAAVTPWTAWAAEETAASGVQERIIAGQVGGDLPAKQFRITLPDRYGLGLEFESPHAPMSLEMSTLEGAVLESWQGEPGQTPPLAINLPAGQYLLLVDTDQKQPTPFRLRVRGLAGAGVAGDHQPVVGDFDGNGGVDNKDIVLFKYAMSNSASFLANHPDWDEHKLAAVGDINRDGVIDALDIAPFHKMTSPQANAGKQAAPSPDGPVALPTQADEVASTADVSESGSELSTPPESRGDASDAGEGALAPPAVADTAPLPDSTTLAIDDQPPDPQFSDQVPVYTSIGHRGKPDLTQYGLRPFSLITTSWIFGQERPLPDQPNEDRIRWLARRLPTDRPVCLDIEHWPLDDQHLAQTVAKLCQIADWIRDENPDVKFGFYMLPPTRNWRLGYASINHQTNQQWIKNLAAFDPLAARVDYIFPSLYWFSDDYNVWARFAQRTVKYSRRWDKPVIPFIWCRYHPNHDRNGEPQNPKKNNFIEGEYWRQQLELLGDVADGIAIYGSSQTTWNPDREWWQETRELLATPMSQVTARQTSYD